MSILSDSAIVAAVHAGDIVIEPFDLSCLGGNSYDVHLSEWLLTYDLHAGEVWAPLDVRREPRVREHRIGPDGFTLVPGKLYLASTVEYTETHRHVPYLDGKSSTGRLGISIHTTAGRGDVGFSNHWTMELSVVEPVTVVAGMAIGQLTYHTVEGSVQRVYSTKPGSAYGHLQRDPKPQPSRLWVKLGAR